MELETILKIATIIVLIIFLLYNIMGTPAANQNSDPKDQTSDVDENSLTPASPIPPTPPPTPPPSPPPSPQPPPVYAFTTTFTLASGTNPSTIDLAVFDSSKVTIFKNTISIPSTLVPQILTFTGSFNQTQYSTLDIMGIQYNNSFGIIMFYGYDNSNYPPAMNLIPSPSLGLTIDDTSSPASIYDTTTVSVNGNELTLTSGSDTLTITFPNPFQ